MVSNGIRLLTGNAHPDLANQVAERLGIQVTPCVLKRFADQSIDVRIGASVRDEDVFVMQTSSGPTADTNDALMELLILLSACKTASARRITAVIPSFPYSRHDKKDKSRQPITGKLIANMITTAGADHVITMDLHAAQVQGFFDIPVDNLVAEPSVSRWIRTHVRDWRNAIVVSPDAGGAKRATAVADSLGLDFALINRNRKREAHRARAKAKNTYTDPTQTPLTGSLILDNQDVLPLAPSEVHLGLTPIANGVQVKPSGDWVITDDDGTMVSSGGSRSATPARVPGGPSAAVSDADSTASDGEEEEHKMEILVGDVQGRTAILVDDMVDTGRTLALAAKTLKNAGAEAVYSINVHGLLSGKAMDLVNALPLEKLVVTNTVSQSDKLAQSPKLEVMDISALIAESIRRTHNGESISALFREDAAIMF